MDLQTIFTDNPACLLAGHDREEIWRILNVGVGTLNYLQHWLERRLLNVTINWVEFDVNTSILKNEVLAERMGLVRLVADPLLLDDFQGKLGEDDCTERTCLLFEIKMDNPGPTIMDVLTANMQWIPLGNQAQRFHVPPHPLYPGQVITRLRPGDRLDMRCYAIRATAEENVKWSSTFVHYRLIPTRTSLQQPVLVTVRPTLPPGIENLQCVPCEELPLNIQRLPGFTCYYFTVELTGGLSFEEIGAQLREKFDWGGRYPESPLEYLLPPGSSIF